MSDKIMKVFAKMLEKTMNPMPNHCIECDKPTQETLCSECMAKEDEPESPEAQRSVDDDTLGHLIENHKEDVNKVLFGDNDE